MKSFTLSALLPSIALAASVQKRQNPEYASFKDELDLMPFYGYVVHEPVNWNQSSPPPAVVFLGGTGSRGNDTAMFNEWSTWNGPGKRLKEYLSGNITEVSSLVAEQFVLITPIAPDEDMKEWRTEHIKPVVEDARSKYTFDNDRLYLAGFSMGAREAWRLLKNDTEYWTAAVICAGEPESLDGIDVVRDIPIRHYQGDQDYVSIAEHAYQTQEALDAVQGHSQLIIVNGTSHNSMADTPWQLDMMQWLLQQTKLNRTTTDIPATASSVSSTSGEAAPSANAINAVDNTSDARQIGIVSAIWILSVATLVV